ncbi:MAG: dephospho-CoA kinase [Lachnospiraceae bacterium]|nr:dephospho-CoA kinase [Lachnospiraceae bacterium]
MKRPFVIGVTGGAGAGKSACLSYIEANYDCLVIYADPEAAKLKKRGACCYEPVVELLGEEILGEDGEIDNALMARKILGDPALTQAVNAIIHPVVNARIRDMIEAERRSAAHDFVFVEAALLIESGYEAFVDEMWYIYAREEVRRRRLAETRGYTEQRIDDVFARQLSDAEFRAHCAVVIDNSDELIETRKQIDRILGEHIGGTERSAQ